MSDSVLNIRRLLKLLIFMFHSKIIEAEANRDLEKVNHDAAQKRVAPGSVVSDIFNFDAVCVNEDQYLLKAPGLKALLYVNRGQTQKECAS